jgi:2-hydroxychromene-2-carboxylate isomerase
VLELGPQPGNTQVQDGTMKPSVEFWFDFASTYSYPAAMRIEARALEAGVELQWRPFLLGPIFAEQQGLEDSPFNVFPARGRYMWRDLERLCARHALAWKRPSVFPRNSVLAARVALLAAGEPWGPAFIRSLFEANFGRDLDIASEEVVRDLLARAGQPPDFLGRALAPEHKHLLREQTARAAAQGIFGAPNFLVGGELFFGQDRLDDALEWAKRSMG